MFKKIFTIATLLCVIPMLANAATKWQLGTRAMSQGGVIDSRNKTGQTVANGSIFKQYTTANNSTVTVTPNAGFKISKISNNGIVTVAPIAAPFTFAPAGTGNVTIQATFARVSFVLNAIAGSGGTVNKSSYPIVYTGIQSPAKTFIFTPNPGLAVTAITASAGVLNTNFQYLNAVTGLPTGLGVVNEKVKVSVVNVPNNITFSASFVGTPTGGTTPPTGCVNCHATQGIGGGRDVGSVYYNWSSSDRATRVPSCATCHAGADTGAHPGVTSDNCIGCHAVPAPGHNGGVADNNFGVRSIVQEFSKWSHHVTGVNLNNAHCAACHLEGKVANGVVVIDKTYHMADNTTHLRNADTDADMQWDPAAPNHSTMDTYCMSCHDSNGAISAGSQAIQAYLNTNNLTALGKTASATNPFGDTISNQYDKMQRPAVVDAKSQFAPTNNSHHAVLGKRYSGRSRVSKGGTIDDAVFTTNSSANLPGARTTIFDAGKFNALYTPLANAGGETDQLGTLNGRTGSKTLGDDSTLHCGDCHTVGQYRAADVNLAVGSFNKAAIGAHGSANEYLLRNSIGSDARHQGIPQTAAKGLLMDTVTPLLVCYNCHIVAKYGTGAHVGEQVSENNCNMATNTNTVNTTGTDRLASQYTKTIGTLVAGANSGADFSNIYGIQCNNCHNSGISAGNIFGGIHGSADPTYQDGVNNTTKHERFLPGLGNVMYVPGTRGGITGGTTAFASYSSKVQASGISIGKRFKGSYAYTIGGVTNDTNWEEKLRIPVGDGVTGWSHNPGAAGCYTISSAADDELEPSNGESNGVPAGPSAARGLKAPDGTSLFGNWGGCDDHAQQAGSSVRQPRSGNTSIRPVTY